MNRRSFFRFFSWLLMAPMTYLAFKSIFRDQKSNKKLEVFVPLAIFKQQKFYENLIISGDQNQPDFFLNKCTHLGCRIHNASDNKFICSCHGSEFNSNGQVVKGPAVKPLQKLACQFIPEKNGYLVFEKT